VSAVDYTLYLVTDAPENYPHGLLAGVEAAIAGGASIVQYRATTGTKRHRFETACALRDLLRPRQVPLIINDQVDLALAVDADGVHIGQNDLPADTVRRLIGPEKLLGLSITAPEQLNTVQLKIIDYLGIGPVFPTLSKDDAAPALGLEQLARLTARAPLPVVAIGGINLENAASVFATGVAGLAIISTLSRATNPIAIARALRSTHSQRS